MKSGLKLVIGAVVCALAFGAQAFMGENTSDDEFEKADKRVKRALDAAELKYSIDSDGDYKVSWGLKADRSHVTFVNSNTMTLGEFELREVWAVGFTADDVTDHQMRRLLELNSQYKIGAWSLKKMRNGKYWAIFTATVAADCSGATLKKVTGVVALSADEVEEEFLGTDEL